MPIGTHGTIYIWVVLPLLFLVPLIIIRFYYKKLQENRNKYEVISALIIFPTYWALWNLFTNITPSNTSEYIGLWGPFLAAALISWALLHLTYKVLKTFL